jgi:Type I restriction enzyme R protein N terminus (HSDR_N)
MREEKCAEQLLCRVRKEWVAATPEELVRQRLIALMINELGFPPSAIALEKALSQIPHVAQALHQPPLRRADIICFAKGINPQYDLYPLLLIECKAVKLTPKVINQVASYNHYLQACFVCIANQEEIRTGWFDPETKAYRFVQHLPSYQELLNSIYK